MKRHYKWLSQNFTLFVHVCMILIPITKLIWAKPPGTNQLQIREFNVTDNLLNPVCAMQHFFDPCLAPFHSRALIWIDMNSIFVRKVSVHRRFTLLAFYSAWLASISLARISFAQKGICLSDWSKQYKQTALQSNKNPTMAMTREMHKMRAPDSE